ncbi:MAG: tetratricopeptide repeat protein [Planctomycetes bacterium]|nr:tetratricopeptide repeat protein [Planctomycetota bacterium]
MITRSLLLLALGSVLLVAAAPARAQDLAAAQKLLAAKDYEAAVEAFQALIDQDGVDQFEVRFGLAQASLGNGDPESAVFHAGRAQGMKPDHLGNTEILARSLKVSGDMKRESGSDPSGLYEQALGEFAKLVKAKTRSAEVYADRAVTYYWLGRMGEAGESYARAAELDPKNAVYAYWSAYCYHSANMTGEAADQYVAALASGKLDEATAKTAAQGLYNCYAGAKDWNGFNGKVAAWVKKQPNDELGLWWAGYGLLAEQKPKDALDCWKRLEKASSKLKGEALSFQGTCHQLLGDDKAAIETLVRAAKLGPDGWTPDSDPILKLHAMAGSLYGSGKFGAACELAEKTILPVAVGKRRVNLLSDLGLFYRDWGSNLEAGGKRDEARKCFTKARDHYETAVKEMGKVGDLDNRQRAQIQNDYGLMFQYHFGDNETAVANYKIALTYDKTNSDACLNYGRVLKDLGKLEEALAIARQGAERADLRSLIDQIERKMQGR